MYEYKAVITNVVDGDTFDMDIDLGFHIHIHERVRLLGVDTPETFGEEKRLGLIVKKFAEKNFLNKKVIIYSEKANESADTDSFGRWLVYVILDEDHDILEVDRNIEMIYDGLGINKNYYTYSEANVLKLLKLMEN